MICIYARSLCVILKFDVACTAFPQQLALYTYTLYKFEKNKFNSRFRYLLVHSNFIFFKIFENRDQLINLRR